MKITNIKVLRDGVCTGDASFVTILPLPPEMLRLIETLVCTYFRALKNNKGLSFESISAVGPNAAIIHYRPSQATDKNLTKNEVYLLDSGGQYL